MRFASLLLIIAVGQASDRLGVYRPEQAEAGRLALNANSFGVCTDCHATGLTGRKGDAGELPLVSSLRQDQQDTIKPYGGRVPALVGPEFRKRWANRTTKDLTQEFKERFGKLSDEMLLKYDCLHLQANGASPGTQTLTMKTDVQIRKLTPIEGPNQE